MGGKGCHGGILHIFYNFRVCFIVLVVIIFFRRQYLIRYLFVTISLSTSQEIYSELLPIINIFPYRQSV